MKCVSEYRRCCWSVNCVADLRLVPLHMLAYWVVATLEKSSCWLLDLIDRLSPAINMAGAQGAAHSFSRTAMHVVIPARERQGFEARARESRALRSSRSVRMTWTMNTRGPSWR